MKKTLLALALCAGSFMSANASYIRFINMTDCDFEVFLNGAIGTTGTFGVNSLIVPPGTWPYASPATLPGVVQYGTGSLASGHLEIVKGYDVGGPYTFVVGISPAYPTMSTNYNSASNGYYPVCHNGTAYTVSFSSNFNKDVIVLFL